MKKQETEITRLNHTVKNLESLLPLAEIIENEEKLNKLNDFLERDDEVFNR